VVLVAIAMPAPPGTLLGSAVRIANRRVGPELVGWAWRVTYITTQFPLATSATIKLNSYLNENVQNWLGFSATIGDGTVLYTGNRVKYEKCLLALNYTVFSNTTSATQWNEDHFGVRKLQEEGAPDAAPEAVVPLEGPHNTLHLAIGGLEIPGFNFDHSPGANGDMGENDTASFDPIFYFHHCFIDKGVLGVAEEMGPH
jgi:hypothetical protein